MALHASQLRENVTNSWSISKMIINRPITSQTQQLMYTYTEPNCHSTWYDYGGHYEKDFFVFFLFDLWLLLSKKKKSVWCTVFIKLKRKEEKKNSSIISNGVFFTTGTHSGNRSLFNTIFNSKLTRTVKMDAINQLVLPTCTRNSHRPHGS